MKLSFTTLDVFTTTRYTGNPVAIIEVPGSLSTTLTQEQKQSIASEFNLSEIVFLHLPEEGTSPSSRKIDIFTSKAEVPFAGHPTIGTTHYLLSLPSSPQNVTTVHTKAGPMPISLSSGLASASIPHSYHLHAKTYHSALNGVANPVASIVNGMSFIYVSLPSLSALSQATTNLNEVEFGSTYNSEALDEGWKNGLVGTMYYVFVGEDEEGRKKYRTRMWGSREDPGTGSASSGLACFLALKGEGKKFLFEQGVEMGRRNEIGVEVELKGNGEGIEKVVLSGAAVKVMEGVLEV
ncbi:Diaminopimelate epimerase-like protein [Mollisia scopiformis]|uniref:Diaminopimelate epimerase-like protein n=1 Tax=Mollisia scopiformis TaxID=149040 RepID=A0A194X4H6_MOLSC|nr:Diaminopimelate epimerase-like protein [Mollisia scopiformis]KUJ14964.1 Diaminopimelate epimerase-like protein [Mollisia scopiformis]